MKELSKLQTVLAKHPKTKSKLWEVVQFGEAEGGFGWPEGKPDSLAVDRNGRLYLGHRGNRKSEEMPDSEYYPCTAPESLEWMAWGWKKQKWADPCDLELYFLALLDASLQQCKRATRLAGHCLRFKR